MSRENSDQPGLLPSGMRVLTVCIKKAKTLSYPLSALQRQIRQGEMPTSQKHLRKKVTPDLHLTYSKNWGNLGLVLNDKKWKFLHKIIKSYVVAIY